MTPDRAAAAGVHDAASVQRARCLDRVVPTLDAVERLARAGRWVVGFVSFEAVAGFDPAFAALAAGSLPLAWFASSPRQSFTDRRSRDGRPAIRRAMPTELAPERGVRRGYADQCPDPRVIDAGDVYQVNLTVPFTALRDCPPRAIYERMRRAQAGAYSRLLDIGDAQILSASPELFFERYGDRIHSRPMKGTAPRGLHPAADDAARDGSCSRRRSAPRTS